MRPSQFPRTGNTLRLHHLMEETQRLEIAERIRQLRERSPFTQPEVAEKLEIGLRAYQKLEERGTTKWERCEELARIYEVDPGWIWDGREKGPTPDVIGTLNGSDAKGLRAVSEAVQELRSEVRATRTEVLAELGKVREAQEALLRRQAPGRRGRAAKRS